MKKIIIITIIISFLAAPITYLIILALDRIVLPALPFIIVEGSKDSWIAFFGTLFSGIITLIALIFTIKYENQRQIKDEIKSIRPFIIAKPVLKDYSMDMLNIENDSYFYNFFTSVENVSDNLLKDLQIVEENVYLYNENTGKYDLNLQKLIEDNATNYGIFTVIIDESELLAPHKTFNFQTNVIISNYSESSRNGSNSFYVKTILKYRDAMDKIEYLYQLEYYIYINYSRDNEFNISTSDTKGKIVEEVSLKVENK